MVLHVFTRLSDHITPDRKGLSASIRGRWIFSWPHQRLCSRTWATCSVGQRSVRGLLEGEEEMKLLRGLWLELVQSPTAS